jgi:F-type H+-transporting ATPase subunit a
MPEHTTFLSYLFARLGLHAKAEVAGSLVISGRTVEPHHIDALGTSFLIMLLIMLMAGVVRSQFTKVKSAVVPESTLTLRTFFELFVGYFYDAAKETMGAKRAKKFFPLIGTCALFIFFSNVLGLIPGMEPPTSSLNVTAGCGLLVFFAFNAYGLRENGLGYIKHLFGPWLGAPYIPINILIFVVECISYIVRPITLAVRLMINMAVDHLIGSIFLGLFALLLPLPVMVLGVLVILVQTLVFCLLASVYIGLATEHEEH